MNINRVQITLEPHIQPHLHTMATRILKIKIERWPGEDLYLQQEIPDDDLQSLWDYIWEEAGKQLKRAMEETSS